MPYGGSQYHDWKALLEGYHLGQTESKSAENSARAGGIYILGRVLTWPLGLFGRVVKAPDSKPEGRGFKPRARHKPRRSVPGSWGKTMRDAVINKDSWKWRHTPTQYPSTNNAALPLRLLGLHSQLQRLRLTPHVTAVASFKRCTPAAGLAAQPAREHSGIQKGHSLALSRSPSRPLALAPACEILTY